MKRLLEEVKNSDSIYKPIPARIASMMPLTDSRYALHNRTTA